MYKHILLDADNTLYDFDKAESLSLKATLEHLGIAFSQSVNDTYSAINMNLWKMYEKNLIEKETIKARRFSELFEVLGADADAYAASEVYRKNLEMQPVLLPHAEQVCAELSKRFVLSIVTNGVSTTQRSRFSLSPLGKYIKHLIISEDLGTAKPHAEFFEAAFKIIGSPAKQDVLMVGDSLSSDIQGAMNYGIDCCWFNPKRVPRGGDYDVDYEISDLRELGEILLGKSLVVL